MRCSAMRVIRRLPESTLGPRGADDINSRPRLSISRYFHPANTMFDQAKSLLSACMISSVWVKSLAGGGCHHRTNDAIAVTSAVMTEDIIVKIQLIYQVVLPVEYITAMIWLRSRITFIVRVDTHYPCEIPGQLSPELRYSTAVQEQLNRTYLIKAWQSIDF